MYDNIPSGIAYIIGFVALAAIALDIIAFRIIAKLSKGQSKSEFYKMLATKDDIRGVNENIERSRAAYERQAREGREESNKRLDALREGLTGGFVKFNEVQSKQWDMIGERINRMNRSNIDKLEEVRNTVDAKLTELQAGNEKKLDEMRGVVDDRLQKTLEERLGSSFKMVSEQLELVYKSLGEMKGLSKDMGDIKNIFKNVKTRGTWGEVQLAALLEEMLTPEQYASNVKLKTGSDEIVEFAIKLPGAGSGNVVWLPIDSKFPIEDFQRLEDAVERGDGEGMATASRALEQRVIFQARDIRNKYINPPKTTNFAILFVPVESLFAEILRRPGLIERIQQEFNVTVAGPTTLASLLNALRMGFRTLAIQKSSSEVWKLLANIKKQFNVFGEDLGKVKGYMERAVKSVDDSLNRTNMIQRKLDKVEALPIHESPEQQLLSTGTMGQEKGPTLME